MTAVLVAEDDPAQLQGLTAYLRHAGFQVYPARNGREAIAVGEQVKPDAAICDWDLGGAPDGAAVVLELQSVNPNLVPIFITGNDVANLQDRTSAVRDATYFAKPIAPERLLEALTSAGCEPVPGS
jgi:DNA-binding response OmpR family regulator